MEQYVAVMETHARVARDVGDVVATAQREREAATAQGTAGGKARVTLTAAESALRHSEGQLHAISDAIVRLEQRLQICKRHRTRGSHLIDNAALLSVVVLTLAVAARLLFS